MNLFGKGEKSDALHFGIHTSKTEREENTQRLLEKLATPPRARMNTALVSHTSNLNSAVQIFPRPEGVAHVFKPEGRGTFSYVGMVLPETWINSKPLPSADQAGENKEGWLSSIKQWFSF